MRHNLAAPAHAKVGQTPCVHACMHVRSTCAASACAEAISAADYGDDEQEDEVEEEEADGVRTRQMLAHDALGWAAVALTLCLPPPPRLMLLLAGVWRCTQHGVAGAAARTTPRG
jgi:hypothetical protein